MLRFAAVWRHQLWMRRRLGLADFRAALGGRPRLGCDETLFYALEALLCVLLTG